MRKIAGTYVGLALVLALTGLTLAWGQDSASESELSPRDMFRKSVGRLVPAPANPAAPAAPPARPAAPAPPSPEPSSEPSRASVPAPVPPTPQPRPSPAAPADSRADDRLTEPTLVSTGEPLGLRYSILKQIDGGVTEVDSETVFRSGDRIRLTVATTETAYVYVVAQGSSGRWRVLFPSPEIGQGSNLVPEGLIYPIPAAHWFAFDEQVGQENVFVMVSREPEKDLDALIYQLKESGPDSAPPQDGPVLMAVNIPPVDDSLISRLREEVIARDLVFEKVDDSGSAGTGDVMKPEKAVYIVNKTGANDSRVIADIKLQHR